METLNPTHSLTHSHTFTTPSFIDDDSLLHECRLAADLEPVVGDMLHRIELCLPVVHFLLERLDERRTLHRLRLDDVILQYQLDFVDRRQYRHALSQHRHVRPTILHSMPHLTSSLSPTTETIMVVCVQDISITSIHYLDQFSESESTGSDFQHPIRGVKRSQL